MSELKSFEELKIALCRIIYNSGYKSIHDINNIDINNCIEMMDKSMSVKLSGVYFNEDSSLILMVFYDPYKGHGRSGKINKHSIQLTSDDYKIFLRIKKIDQLDI